MSGFLLLPEEILIRILLEVPTNDLLKCSRACKQLYLIVLSSLSIQHRIELLASGYVDMPSSLTAAQRIAILQAHTDSWSLLSCPLREIIELPPGIGLGWTCDVRNGCFLEADNNHLVLLRLPTRSGEPAEITLPEGIPSPEKAFVDPQQNVIVLITRNNNFSCLNITFRTLSGDAHPDAVPLEYRQTWIGEFPGVRLLASDFSGDYVGVIVMSFVGAARVCDTLIWEWRTGTEVCFCRNSVGKVYEVFSFLSPTSFMTCNGAGTRLTIDIYSFAEFGAPPLLIRSLDLPRLQCDIRCHVTIVPNRAANSPTRYGPSSRGAPIYSDNDSGSTLPFAVLPEDRLVSLVLRVSKVMGRVVETVTYTVCMLAETLMRSTVTSGERLCDAPGDSSLPWLHWGPSSTRWIEHAPDVAQSVIGPNFIHGYRVALYSRSQVERGYCYMVLDFNPRAVKRTSLRSEYGHDDPRRIITQPSRIVSSQYWVEHIESRLPYLEASTKQGFHPPGWLFMDGERIMIMRTKRVNSAPSEQRKLRHSLEVFVV